MDRQLGLGWGKGRAHAVRAWWSRIARLHQRPRATAPAPLVRRPRDYTVAGWPRCPQCGEDELMSTAPIAISRQPAPTDPMRCLGCGWTGEVRAPER